MARWRLTQPHYLNTPGTEFEYKETSHYGKTVKKIFPVPQYLDPEAFSDCNYNANGEPRSGRDMNTPGEIIVAHDTEAKKGRDIIFVGDPTLDMVPLDEEAEIISAALAPKWGRAFIGDGEDEGGYSNRLLTELTETLNSFNATKSPTSAAPDDGRIAKVEDQLQKMFEMNMALLAKLEPPTSKRI